MALVATATWDGPTVRMTTAGAATATAATARVAMARVEVLHWGPSVGGGRLIGQYSTSYPSRNGHTHRTIPWWSPKVLSR